MFGYEIAAVIKIECVRAAMLKSMFLGTSSRPIGYDRKLLHALFIEESLPRLRPLDADMQ